MTCGEMTYGRPNKSSSRWAKRVITSGVRKRTQRESARVRTVKCYLYTSRRVHGSCCCLDTKLPERTKNLKSAQDHKWNPDSSDFDNNWDLLTLTSPYKSPCTSLCVTLALSKVIADPAILCLTILERAVLALGGPKMKSSTTLCFVHVNDEEKYVWELKLQHSLCCWTDGSNASLCLVSKCIGLWSIPWPCSRWTPTSAFADDIWSDRWHSGPACLFTLTLLMKSVFSKTISLFVRCFITDVNLGDVFEILYVLFSPTVHQFRSSVDLVVVPSVQCMS